jgi:glc operon protein GlcG
LICRVVSDLGGHTVSLRFLYARSRLFVTRSGIIFWGAVEKCGLGDSQPFAKNTTRWTLPAVLASLAMFTSNLLKSTLIKSCVFAIAIVILSSLLTASAAELPSKKYLNLATVKAMIAAAEAEAQRQHVEVTLVVVDENGNLLFLEKADAAPVNTLQWAQKKARHAAFYRSPSKDAADLVKKGSVEALAYPDFFPGQGGLPIIVDGQILGGIAASGAKSEVDEMIAQAGLDVLVKK